MPAETKWTRGPWRIECVSDAVRVVIGAGRQKIILGRFNPKQLREAETTANARLAAAAPDLYEALQNSLDTIEEMFTALHKERESVYTWQDFQEAPEMKQITAALAKARGEDAQR